jgi:4-carboxymuconolactone decarboxylase
VSRIPYLAEAAMTPHQLRRSRELVASRGGGPVTGPGAFWLYNPYMSEVAEPLRLHMERGTSLPHGLSELAILMTARHWSATYAWCRHEPQVIKDGIDATAIAAVRDGKTPVFSDPHASLVYDVARELLTTATLSDATYARALDAFGLPTTVDLVTMVGYGSQVSLVNATFEPDAPAGATDYLSPAAPPTQPPARALIARAPDDGTDGLIGPAARAWRHSPKILERVQDYDAVLRQHLIMAPDMSWLIVLVIARYWSVQLLWPSLCRQALDHGIDLRAVEAVARGRRPDGLSDGQASVYDFAHELLTAGRPSEATFGRIRERFGFTTMIETAAIIGLMTIVALPANVFGSERM